jgi:hypothetical protein
VSGASSGPEGSGADLGREEKGEPARGGDRLRRTGLGLILICWLYGVPFLLIVGLIRRTESPTFADLASAERYGHGTDRLLVAGLLLNVVLPVAGLVLARLGRVRCSKRQFGGALVGAVVIFALLGLAGGRAHAPLIGTTPPDTGPPPPVTHCIPRSGGQGCPGG